MHLLAYLSVVTDFSSRNLPDSFFQLIHHNFIEDQDSLPEKKKQKNNRSMTNRKMTVSPAILFTVVLVASGNKLEVAEKLRFSLVCWTLPNIQNIFYDF